MEIGFILSRCTACCCCCEITAELLLTLLLMLLCLLMSGRILAGVCDVFAFVTALIDRFRFSAPELYECEVVFNVRLGGKELLGDNKPVLDLSLGRRLVKLWREEEAGR